MRHWFAIIVLALLCTACSEQPPQPEERWFKTYQSDRDYQSARPFVHTEDIQGPTGRAHPF